MEGEACIHCGACTRHCEFLKKYQIDLGSGERLKDLAYHCFLCGQCKTVCPVGIDGKEVFLELRRKQVEQNHGKIAEEGYEMLIKEKQNYIFRNYKKACSETVLFPGCNFPSFYPQTTKKLVSLLSREMGTGAVYDCCGKPISELGLKQQEEQIIRHMNERLKKAGVQEIITVCSNCYYFLRNRLDVRVTGIYEVLGRLKIGKQLEKEEIYLFTPCPDKESRLWQRQMADYLPERVRVIDDVPCCGLGGCARGKEPEISKGFTEALQREGYGTIHTYCASCAGKFARDGMPSVHHLLTDILQTYEKPDIARSMMNRARSKFW